LDGVSVDLDEAGADLLGDFMMGMAADPAVVCPSPVASPSQRPVWHVSQGQTLDGIARAVRVPVMVLARYNHLANPNQIDVGQVLSIPQEVRVKSGDTLSGIVDGLHEAGITWQFIADVNQINPNRLWVGQQVWV
jgi:nucleoid-associated protein YgaU